MPRKDEAVSLLQSTLDEESEARELLNRLAEGIVNPEALIETQVVAPGSNQHRN